MRVQPGRGAVASLFSVLFLLLLPLSYGQESPTDAFVSVQRTVLTEGGATALLLPELIAQPHVENLSFSPDSRYLLAVRTNVKLPSSQLNRAALPTSLPSGDLSLVLWDSRTRTSTEVWKGKYPEVSLEEIQWLPQSETALILAQQTTLPDSAAPQAEAKTQTFLLTVHGGAASTKAVEQLSLSEDRMYQITVSPKLPLAMLVAYPMNGDAPGAAADAPAPPKQTYYFLNGPESSWKPLTTDFKGRPSIQWGDLGQPMLSEWIKEPGRKGTIKWYEVNRETGELLPSTAPKPEEAASSAQDGLTVAENKAAPLRITATDTAAKIEETQRKVSLLWLISSTKSENPRALICGDCSDGILLPGGQVIVYRSRGAAWAVPLMKLSRDDYELLSFQERRVKAIDQAKQFAVALIVYAQDWNERYPAPEEISKVVPYLKNPDDLKDVTYTYKGGPMAAIENPSQTELGAVNIPGGRAILYADGHVLWKNN